MNKVYIPVNNPDQWAQFLAEPERHWRKGYSARTLAYCWQEADGFPKEVQQVFSDSEQFKDIELLLAIPEHKVALPGGIRASQNDIWALARANGKLVSIAVEGKVSEPFGPTIGEWLKEKSPGKDKRLDYLCGLLELDKSPSLDLRYQLFHRTASAIIEAKRFMATHAIMLIHSFSQSNDWLGDYASFLSQFGAAAETNKLISVGIRNGIILHFAWIRGNSRYLSK
jgi:hypothetical protein